MSDFRGVGAVSATLQTLLSDRMQLPSGVAGPIPVTVGAPVEDPAPDTATAEPARVNLFLYRVTENAALKNQEIPGHGHPGAYGHPPLSLCLHYLVTAYGTTTQNDLTDERLAHDLLGSAMRVLHDFAIVDDRLRRLVVPPIGTPILDATLLDEFERMKVTLEPLTLDDLSKLWTALERRVRVSAPYEVSVVQIESRRPRRFPRPVGEPPAAGPRVVVVTLRSPQIRELRVRRFDDVSATERAVPYARALDTLVLLGHGFAGATHVTIGGLDVPPAVVAEDRVEVQIPDDMLGAAVIPEERRLQPGAHAVSVVLGVSEIPGAGFRSSEAAFMLVPTVSAVTPALALSTRRLTVDGRRLLSGAATGEVIVGRAVIPRAAYLPGATPTQVVVPLPDTLPGTPVRCLVSGNLAAFPALAASATLDVEIGPGGAQTIGLTSPPTLAEAPDALQTAIRTVATGGPGFRGARVAAVQAGAAAHLVIVPGGLHADVIVTPVAGDPAAGQLFLTAPPAVLRDGCLSGELAPFPALTAAQPRLRVTIGATQDVALATRPTTLAEAAARVQDAIRLGDPGDPAFAGALAVVVGQQLLIVPGAAQAVSVAAVPGVDDTSAAELQLATRQAVRVRVNGAESFDDRTVSLP
jgi:hypothetical protein